MLKELITKERNSKLSELTDNELLNVLAFRCNGVFFKHTSAALRNEITSRNIDYTGFVKLFDEQTNRIKTYSSRNDFFSKKSFALFIQHDCCGSAIGEIARDKFLEVYNQPYTDYIGI